jgi:glutathione peroxidase
MKKAKDRTDYRTIGFNTITGKPASLADYDGKVILVVNTASKCELTPQYDGLERLYQFFKDGGLVILGFPANDFDNQEPGSNREIMDYCQTNFGITFPMMSKISVKGDDIHPFFKYLTEDSEIAGEIEWNFSKFLFDRRGKLVARFDSLVEPNSDELIDEIKKLI